MTKLISRAIGYTNVDNSCLQTRFGTFANSFDNIITWDFVKTPYDTLHLADMLQTTSPMDDVLMDGLQLEHFFFCGTGQTEKLTEKLNDGDQSLENAESGKFHGYRSAELLEDLTNFSFSLPVSTVQLEHLKVLLSPHNIKIFVERFFHYWYPHCPIVHLPSFDIGSASLPLLFAMAIIGSIYSPAKDSKDYSVTEIFDLAEEYAFLNPIFTSLTLGDCTLCHSVGALEAVQAAFLISKVQIFAGSTYSRRRIRLSRFGDIVIVRPMFPSRFWSDEYLGCSDNVSDECVYKIC
jgi:hypothetical protein